VGRITVPETIAREVVVDTTTKKEEEADLEAIGNEIGTATGAGTETGTGTGRGAGREEAGEERTGVVQEGDTSHMIRQKIGNVIPGVTMMKRCRRNMIASVCKEGGGRIGIIISRRWWGKKQHTYINDSNSGGLVGLAVAGVKATALNGYFIIA